MICSVGYALNPKKLRKSGLDETTHQEPATPQQISPRSSSTSSSCPTANQTNPLTNIWRGGGLADIISGGLECEGVKFIPWNYDVPIALQVRKNILWKAHSLLLDDEGPSSASDRCNPSVVHVTVIRSTAYFAVIVYLTVLHPHLHITFPTFSHLSSSSL